MVFRTLNESELEKWFYHCASVFGENQNLDFWLDYFKRHYFNDPFRDINSIFVAADGSSIASTVRLFYRKIYFHGEEITVGGIGEVSTKHEYRGMGLASKLLCMAVDTMRKKRLCISILFASLHNFYGKFGYKVLPREFCLVDRDTFQKYYESKTTQIGEIKEINLSDNNVEIIDEIYNLYSTNFNGPVVRNREYWLGWVKLEPKTSLGYFVEGRLAAYLFYRKNGKEINILEYGCSDSSNKEIPLMEFIKFIINNENAEAIKYPKAIGLELTGCTEYKDNSLMLNLITPFKLEGLLVDSTEKLISILTREPNKFLFWGTDNF
ncbi:GCN5-related N-acetyltransferase [Caldicellulosiruptor kronotskyensis 2002]|uniref:GCN5-related N-acetyltransferase n=1 Tax=Caldicellulosiruptor kronotskyensis (strain DSM 18902 / VKM B-2412 / 2002) TaxID=632348 RepID=E4SCG4_CALK2|nr:GNAT family N-acetyltransferase [Caldicellulosiruptor kronotskyensis]ADQ45019.1 GCN5-related N-acetyltransferase [Caldicellulosiruptor kronotskyensis 2002]